MAGGSVKPARRSPKGISVSKTSLGTFDECERKWALGYRPWLLPPEMEREARLQHKLMPFPALVGQVVDDTITAGLRLYHRKGYWPKDWHAGARDLLAQYWKASAEWIRAAETGGDLPELRRQPVDRVFFGEPLSEAENARLLERIDESLDVFLASEVRDWAAGFDVAMWELPQSGETPWFLWDGIPVWAKYDFAIRTPERTYLVDWKTGKIDVASAREQLHIYAAYAIETWSVPRDQLTLRTVWLAAGPESCVNDEEVDVDVLGRLYAQFRERHALLTARDAEARKGPGALFEQFPKTGFPNRCRWCAFRVCEGYAEALRLRSEGEASAGA